MMVQFPEGDGIFETIKTTRGIPFALSRHITRASRSASILGMRIPSEREIRDAVSGVLSKTPESLEFGRLRVTFQRDGELELVHETYHPWSNPARLTISERPIDETSPSIGMKTLPFNENIECLKWAHEQGFDDAVRFNTSGEVAESAISNLLLKIDGQWVTPNLSSGCLPGITRGLVLEWFDVAEKTLIREDLENAQSIYLLSSLKDAQPVSVLGQRALEIDTALGRELADRMAQDIDP